MQCIQPVTVADPTKIGPPMKKVVQKVGGVQAKFGGVRTPHPSSGCAPARRYAKRGICRRRVSVRPSVRPSANNATRQILNGMFCSYRISDLLTTASRGPSAIAELLVFTKGDYIKSCQKDDKSPLKGASFAHVTIFLSAQLWTCKKISPPHAASWDQ